MKILRISEKSIGIIIVKQLKFLNVIIVRKESYGNFAHCFHFVQVFEEGLYADILSHTREGMTD